ncbi:MAG: UvrB/UvrC motif-containing protein, partial [Gemmatimonadota bacterium]|nr:UvrB/UvrC motif-containing protein [Gemmatimonadota bacterium]
RSLIQTTGRAARHLNGRAIFYADRITGSMKRCMDETARRRTTQIAYNLEHGITPRSVIKSTDQVRFITRVADARSERQDRQSEQTRRIAESSPEYARIGDIDALIKSLENDMKVAAKDLDFESAARIRDQLFELRAQRDAKAKKTSPSLAALRNE